MTWLCVVHFRLCLCFCCGCGVGGWYLAVVVFWFAFGVLSCVGCCVCLLFACSSSLCFGLVLVVMVCCVLFVGCHAVLSLLSSAHSDLSSKHLLLSSEHAFHLFVCTYLVFVSPRLLWRC